MSQIRQFRHSVAVLKKQGLLPKSIDARSVYPNSKVRGKKLSTLVRKNDDIVSGKSSAVKVPPAKLKQLRKAGFETQQGRVIYPHSATEKPVFRAGEISLINRSGLERVQIHIPFQDVEKYLRDIQRDAKRINAMKRKNEYFGFKIYGNSTNVYGSIELALEALSGYLSSFTHKSRAKQLDVFKNLELIKIGNLNKWTFPGERSTASTRAYRKRSAAKFRARLKRKPKGIRQQYLDATAARMKAYRARLKRNKKQYSKYLKDGQKRAAASRKALDKAVKKQTAKAQTTARKALKKATTRKGKKK